MRVQWFTHSEIHYPPGPLWINSNHERCVGAHVLAGSQDLRIGRELVHFFFLCLCPCPVSSRQKAKFLETAEATLCYCLVPTAAFSRRGQQRPPNRLAPTLQVRTTNEIHKLSQGLISKLSSEVNVVSILSGYVMHEMACARVTLGRALVKDSSRKEI